MPPKKKAKKDTKSRGWVFTYHTTSDEDYWSKIEGVEYLVIGKEKGENGITPHHQGYIYFKNARSFSAVKKLFPSTVHIEKQAGTCQEASDYCEKEGEVIAKVGKLPSQGKRTDLDKIKQLVKDGANMRAVIDEATSYQAMKAGEMLIKYRPPPHRDTLQVIWLYGPTGTGKTHYAREQCPIDDVWESMEDLKWWEGYDGQSHVIIDDLRKESCSFPTLLRSLDKYPYRVPIKGGSTPLCATTIYITAPLHPSEMFQFCGEDVNQLLRRITKIICFTTTGRVVDKDHAKLLTTFTSRATILSALTVS